MSSDPQVVAVNLPSSWHQARDRLLEAAPGLLTWTLLSAPAWIPFLLGMQGAFAVAFGILLFDIYWLGRSIQVVAGTWGVYSKVKLAMATDWLARCRDEEVPEGMPAPLSYYQLCIIPTYTEPYSVLERTVQAIVEANYPSELKLIGIITRETDKPGWANIARLREKFGDRVAGFHHIKDPLEPPLVPGKSAAMNWGGREMVKRLTAEGFDLGQVIVTDLDSDYRVHREYFAWLSYHHARRPLRDYTIWQPIPLFHNNIWRVPTAVRVMSAAAHQVQMYLMSQKRRLVAFSSYSCTLQMVHEVGYWDKDVIPEDSRFYWKSFFRLGSKFSVQPCYLPLYGDSPESKDYSSTHLNQYNQIKRWAWGVSDIPYVARRIFKHPEIPLHLRLYRFMNLILNHVNWVFLPVLLMFGSNMPIWVSVDFSITDFGQNLWVYTTVILMCALSTTLVLIYIEHKMLPPKPAEWGRMRRMSIYVLYFTYPIVGLILSAVPALEAHTRLLLGKYLEYRVTEKV